MSIRSSFERVKEVNKKFTSKSYSNLKLKYEVLDAGEFLSDRESSDTKERIYQREYVVDKVPEIIKIYSKHEGEMINLYELRAFFFDMGFNVDASFSEMFKADMVMVYNVGGYLIPFWESILKKIFKGHSPYRNMLRTAIAPGKKRLHCRLYHGSDGCWYLTSHIDHANWFNILTLKGVIVSHLQKGTGDYILGTKIMKRALYQIIPLFNHGKKFSIDINEIYEDLIKES